MGLGDSLRRAARRKRWSGPTRPEILLCGNVPKPMHGVAPRVILGGKWWDATRQACYKTTDYCCLACGIPKEVARSRQWLEGHELYDIDYLLGRMEYLETVPLCHYCHNYIHSGRLQALLDSQEISQAKFVAVMRYGDRVLKAAGLNKPEPYEGPFAEWGDWRLVLNSKEYPPKFKTMVQWEQAFNYDPLKEDTDPNPYGG